MTKIFYHNYADPWRFDHFDPTEKIFSPMEAKGRYVQRFHLENGTFMVWSTPKGRYITEHEMSFIEFEDGKTPPKTQWKDEHGKPYDIIYNNANGARLSDGIISFGNGGGIKLKASTSVLVEAVVDAKLRAAAANGDYNLRRCIKLMNCYEHADVNAADEDGNDPRSTTLMRVVDPHCTIFCSDNGDLEKPNNASYGRTMYTKKWRQGRRNIE